MDPKVIPPGITMGQPNSHNYCPKPIKEITDQDFWHCFSTYGCGREQTFHQIKDLPGAEDEGLTTFHIFWYSGNAYGIATKYRWNDKEKPWEVHFYKIGCDHKNKKNIYTPRSARDG